MIKVAIIEDDQAISQMYRIKFEAEGYIVDTAGNGKLGLELIEKTKPEIILLDIMMPEMTGNELLRQLRTTDWGKDIRVIILSNLSEQEIPDDLKNYGVSAYIVKAHSTPAQVLETVRKVLNNS